MRMPSVHVPTYGELGRLAIAALVLCVTLGGCDWFSGSAGVGGPPARFDTVEPGPCVFGPEADQDALQKVLRDWVAANQLGTLTEWNVAVDKARADLTLGLGEDRLQIGWQLEPDCRTGAIEAKVRSGARPTPPETAVRTLVDKVPLARVVPKLGEHPKSGS